MLTAATLRIWRADFSVPFDTTGDAGALASAIRATLKFGWYLHNPLLAAPFGQNMTDFAAFSGDHLQVLAVRVLGLFVANSTEVMNLYYLFTFPVIALVAHLVLRRLGISRPAALVLATIYALLPYHVARGEGQVFIANYAAIPLGLLLALRALAGEPLFAVDRARTGVRRYLTRRTVTTAAKPSSQVLAGAIAGFAGVVLDLRGWPRRGMQVETAVARVTGAVPLRRGPLVFFDLRAVAAQLLRGRSAATRAALAARILHPPFLAATSGLSPMRPTANGNDRWMGSRAMITVRNPLAVARRVRLRASLTPAASGLGSLAIRLPDGRTQVFGTADGRISLVFVLPAGGARLVLSTDAPAVRRFDTGIDEPRLRLGDMIASDVALGVSGY